MNRIIVGSSLMVFASCAAFAQTTPLSFEVASLKPTASPDTADRVIRQMSGGPGSSDPGRFTYTNVTLKLLIEMAYNLKEFQVEGPPWIENVGFDLVATMPRETTREQAAQMMQTLLADRFKLEFHRETKPLSQFALMVGKGGSKMKEVDVPTPTPGVAPTGQAGPGRGGPGIRMMMSPAGIHLAGQMTMTQLANALTRQMARPVQDETELPKTYDVDITWMPDNLVSAAQGGPSGGDSGDGGHRGGPEPAFTLAQALQEKLGLKLDARKAPAEVLIIDRAEKAPVEN